MTFDEYQILARRTQNRGLTGHQRREHAVCGLGAEAGEVLALFQKVHQGHLLKTEDVVKEMGDVLWMLSELCDVMGVSLGDVAQINIAKLRARYPEGFDADKSLHREAE